MRLPLVYAKKRPFTFTLFLAGPAAGAHHFSLMLQAVGLPSVTLLTLQNCWSCIVSDDIIAVTSEEKRLQGTGPIEEGACRSRFFFPLINQHLSEKIYRSVNC